MNFKKLTMVIASTGERITLYDGKNFQNFERLKELIGDEDAYINFNDDLMDGPTVNGDTFQHFLYDNMNVREVLTFIYE